MVGYPVNSPPFQLHFLPQDVCGEKIPVSPGNQPLAKDPEESGYEITEWAVNSILKQ